MSDAKFETTEGLLAWAGVLGNHGVMPINGSNGWDLHIRGGEESPISIESGFYDIEARPPYGAFMIVGHCFPFGDREVSGEIRFAFKDGKPVVESRRRITEKDSLGEGHKIIDVIIVQPDRVEEPVAVVITEADEGQYASLEADAWLELLDNVRDGAEAEAVRALRLKLV
jgi:hypothetical protein